jgi:transcriptional regulator with PAS, ATPase and Fis domain
MASSSGYRAFRSNSTSAGICCGSVAHCARPGAIQHKSTGYLVERYARKAGKRISAISKETLDLSERYDWPGNMQELQNVIERAVILADGDHFAVDPSWLPINTSRRVRRPATIDLADRERAIIGDALCVTRQPAQSGHP